VGGNAVHLALDRFGAARAAARRRYGRVTLSLYLVPAAAIVISLIWLGQLPGPVELAGAAIALGGVLLAGTGGREPASSAEPVVRDEEVKPRPVR
jgi:drug/metabolite transporter (DMT)-like permease